MNYFPALSQARFDAGELITQREKVSNKVSEELTERCQQFGLVLDDISIVSVPFALTWQILVVFIPCPMSIVITRLNFIVYIFCLRAS